MDAPILIGGSSSFDPDFSRPVHNPAHHGELVGRCAVGDAAAADLAVRSAVQAFAAWSALPATERARLMVEAAESVEEGLAERAVLLTREHGKPVSESEHDVAGAGRILRYYSGLAERFDEPEVTDDDLGHIVRLRRPMGPMAIVVPWNAPVYLAFLMIAPALLAGNTVVVKPAGNAPLALSETLRRVASVLPRGVINSVPGPGSVVGSALARHPDVRGIRFTGSVETGRQLMCDAASTIKNLGLELGGNDPAIVLEGARLDDQQISELVTGVYASSGQICYNIKRIYVHDSLHDELVDRFASAVDELVVGDGLDPGATMGPVNNEDQFGLVTDLISRTATTGARVATLGQRADVDWSNGWFIQPTVVTGVEPGDELVTCEQFGPVVPIIAFDSEDRAVRLANDSEYGLAASVWDEDVDHAFSVAGRLEAGTVFVNVHRVGASDVSMEFGGFKQSGLGRGHGWVAVEESSELQVLAHRPVWARDTPRLQPGT